MPISEARRRANLRNAQKSTGPKSDAGKQQARANALKHGLSATVLIAPEEAQALQNRIEEWSPDLPVANENERWMREQLILASIRLDHCQEEKRILRRFEADCAILCWEQDQTRDAEILGAKLGKNPSKIAAELRCSRAGVDWLLKRWEKLAAMLDNGVSFEDDQRQLVLNLLGEPIETRTADLISLATDSAEELRAMIGSEVEFLQGLRDGALSAIEAARRQAAEAGYPVTESPGMRRLRRYEAEQWKRFQKATEALEVQEACQIDLASSKSKPKGGNGMTRLISQIKAKENNPAPLRQDLPSASIETFDALLNAEIEQSARQDQNQPNVARGQSAQAIVIAPSPQSPPLAITVKRSKPLNRKQRKALQKQMRQGK